MCPWQSKNSKDLMVSHSAVILELYSKTFRSQQGTHRKYEKSSFFASVLYLHWSAKTTAAALIWEDLFSGDGFLLECCMSRDQSREYVFNHGSLA